ncbi:CAP domain-containing protein [Colwellia psychrerythraea]|uniref:SCP-like extracellular n=1 Tax=Colwellia psychrerythraea TaxID=28229 RepID=A0A099KU21_COLPS|nr:CAP domain-containing protein [Colwellia psychrerythraea]KGJ93670.1 SCP-like extracellular [Colwellia psychrerythraea]
MRYWLVGLFYLSVMSGCGSGDEDSGSNQLSGETVSGDEGSAESPDPSSEVDNDAEDIDFSQINCNDDLTTVLALINKVRAQQQSCGGENYGPVDALTWNTLLTLAAQEHSNNMANYDFFSHTGLDDSTVSTRVTTQGYTWSSVAENIAGGQTSAQSVVDAWMSSDGHCKNIMSDNTTEMGLACSANSDATYNYYWTQVFAKPR